MKRRDFLKVGVATLGYYVYHSQVGITSQALAFDRNDKNLNNMILLSHQEPVLFLSFAEEKFDPTIPLAVNLVLGGVVRRSIMAGLPALGTLVVNKLYEWYNRLADTDVEKIEDVNEQIADDNYSQPEESPVFYLNGSYNYLARGPEQANCCMLIWNFDNSDYLNYIHRLQGPPLAGIGLAAKTWPYSYPTARDALLPWVDAWHGIFRTAGPTGIFFDAFYTRAGRAGTWHSLEIMQINGRRLV